MSHHGTIRLGNHVKLNQAAKADLQLLTGSSQVPATVDQHNQTYEAAAQAWTDHAEKTAQSDPAEAGAALLLAAVCELSSLPE